MWDVPVIRQHIFACRALFPHHQMLKNEKKLAGMVKTRLSMCCEFGLSMVDAHQLSVFQHMT